MTKEQIGNNERIAEQYERKVLTGYIQKETANDIYSLHYVFESMWVRFCDFVSDVARYGRKTNRVGRIARKVMRGKKL